ncbi:MAG: hypothetical protein F6K30_25590 [Cyanothece sp. SIO2G6]|nr:hypothetical protein [Cyanothece sp. SIO2G6]
MGANWCFVELTFTKTNSGIADRQGWVNTIALLIPPHVLLAMMQNAIAPLRIWPEIPLHSSLQLRRCNHG